MAIKVYPIAGFQQSSDFGSGVWRDIPWQELESSDSAPEAYKTSVKLAYDPHGFAVLCWCGDTKISCQERNDFDDIYLDDVIELFLWPDQSAPVYFEYELSPLGRELALLVSNKDGDFMGWQPWHYHDQRKIIKRSVVVGGDQRPGASIKGWYGEFFVPFALLKGVVAAPPRSGSIWRGNFFRMDYDTGECRKWALSPVTDGKFHNFLEYPEFVFI